MAERKTFLYCPVCGRLVATYVPAERYDAYADQWGNAVEFQAVRLRRHKPAKCPPPKYPIPLWCPGSELVLLDGGPTEGR